MYANSPHQGRAGRASRSLRRIGATLTAALVASFGAATAQAEEFGIKPGSFTVTTSTTQAGAHPDVSVQFFLNRRVNDGGVEEVIGGLKDTVVDLPGGLTGDNTAVPTCKKAELVAASCPAASQVGEFNLGMLYSGMYLNGPLPLYNMEPANGRTAELAATVFIGPVPMIVRIRDEGDYGLQTIVPNAINTFPISDAGVTLWGVPADHNGGGAARRAFLINPSDCGPQSPAHVLLQTWKSDVTPELTDEATTPMPDITGCENLPAVQPDVSVRPERAAAGEPSGYDIHLRLNHESHPDRLAVPPLRKVSIALPEGVAISPGSVDGLTACADDQLGAGTTNAVACPDASKIGSVSIETPLLDEPLEGSMYLGQPKPGDQFRLFLVAQGSGVRVRLAGSAVPDPATGRLTTTFDGLPQLAFTHLHVHLKGGPRAVLVNPAGCGTVSSTAVVTPYGGGASGTAGDAFTVSGDGSGGACTGAGLSPTLTAGTTNPVAGAFSPFVLELKRGDGQPDIRSMNVDLPAGLIGKVAGLPLCPTAAAVTGACAAASRVGSVAVTVGTGSNPITLPGSAYMTEAYGGPFGLAFVVPAKIGPFDFGTVVVRAKVKVDPTTGALHVETDDLPSIIAGIPLHYRSIAVNLDRSGFMLNPTSCAESQIVATVNGAGGTTGAASTRFQVGDCAGLPLSPKLLMSFTGVKERKRNGKPGLKFVLTQTAGQSNLKSVAVTLPGTVGLSLGLPTPCTIAQFGARSCPLTARVGSSTVWSPLLDQKLTGGVYLVTGDSGKLPRLGVLLDGQVPISLLSEVVTTKGRVNATFSAPDLAISRFELALNPKTALTAAKDLCRSKQKSSVVIVGASGARRSATAPMKVAGCPKATAKNKTKSKAGSKASSRAQARR
jgi:hypothetical protein